MNQQQREQIIQKHLQRCERIRTAKNVEYANDEGNANANFESDNDLGLDAITSVAVFMNKHYRAVRNWVKTRETKSDENIEGRVYDLINYLLILLTIIETNKKLSTGNDTIGDKEIKISE